MLNGRKVAKLKNATKRRGIFKWVKKSLKSSDFKPLTAEASEHKARHSSHTTSPWMASS